MLSACSARPATETANEYTVRLVATRNFGQELILDEAVKIADKTSALDALKKVATVETEYGGGFVNGINDIRSGYTGGQSAKEDWFLYINGILSNVGALDYSLHPGDVEHWDFHNWSFQMLTPATVGAFPESFRYGYGGRVSPTLIVCSDSLREVAENLERQLIQLGVIDTGVRGYGDLSENDRQASNLLLLGTPDDELIAELNQNWRRLGFFAFIEDGGIVALNAEGGIAGRYGTGAGLIQATQNPWNPMGIGACQNVVWVVTGTDEVAVKEAAAVLAADHVKLRYAHAVLIVNKTIIKVP
jgi:hypothetical protein